MGKADSSVLRLQDTVIIVAPVPVFLQMDKDNLLGLQACGQGYRLLIGIESCSGDMLVRVLESMF